MPGLEPLLGRHHRRRGLRPRPLWAARVDPAGHVEGGFPPSPALNTARKLGRVVIVRNVSAAGSVSAGWSASTSFTHTSAPSTPAGRARRVGVDSSSSRSWCVSRCPLSTSASGRDDGAGADVGDVSRTVIYISAGQRWWSMHCCQSGPLPSPAPPASPAKPRGSPAYRLNDSLVPWPAPAVAPLAARTPSCIGPRELRSRPRQTALRACRSGRRACRRLSQTHPE